MDHPVANVQDETAFAAQSLEERNVEMTGALSGRESQSAKSEEQAFEMTSALRWTEVRSGNSAHTSYDNIYEASDLANQFSDVAVTASLSNPKLFLDDALLQSPDLSLDAAAIPLPLSRRRTLCGSEGVQSHQNEIFGREHAWVPSRHRRASSGDATRDSLDMLVRMSRLNPTTVPLPDTVSDASLSQIMKEEPRKMPDDLGLSCDFAGVNNPYSEVLRTASRSLRHIQQGHVCQTESRHDKINLTYIDYTENSQTDPSSCTWDRNNVGFHPTNSFIKKVRTCPSSNVKFRLLIAEDLSPYTIDFLGNFLSVTPEFFEEHLINSGYGGADYDDPPSESWITSGMKKPYATIRWYRSVIRTNEPPHSNTSTADLLGLPNGRLNYYIGQDDRVNYVTLRSNIFRSEWRLSPETEKPTLFDAKRSRDFSSMKSGSESSSSSPVLEAFARSSTAAKLPSGWEERVSIWSGKFPGSNCQVVLLLLDPPPKVYDNLQTEVLRRIRRPIDFDNILNEDGDQMRQAPRQAPKRNTKLQAIWNRFLVYIVKAIRQDELQEKDQAEPEYLVTDVNITSTPRDLIEQAVSRAPLSLAYGEAFSTGNNIAALASELSNTRSTREDLWLWIHNFSRSPDKGNSPIDIVTILAHIVSLDTTKLINTVHTVLNRIDRDLLDDSKMEIQLSSWRSLISRAQFEFSELKQTVSAFFRVNCAEILRIDDFKTDSSIITPEIDSISNLLKDLDRLTARLSQASSAINANMALLESKRSIDEAQSVTKLTELAFLFIPLTFSASLFGMQIEPLENRAPVSVFIGLSMALTTLSYGIRLLIRSQWINDGKRAIMDSVETFSERRRMPLRRGKSVPLSVFLQWFWYQMLHSAIGLRRNLNLAWNLTVHINSRVWKSLNAILGFWLLFVLLVSIVIVPPIAILWTKHMTESLQVAVTLICIVVVAALILPVLWRTSTPIYRTGLLRFVKRGLNFIWNLSAEASHRTVIVGVWLAIVIISVALLAVIWSQHLSIALRVVLTIVIFLLWFVLIIAYGIVRLVSTVQGDAVEAESV